MNRHRVLLLAESCNPDWPSLPVVGYKYACSLARVADVTLVTHVRNRANIERAGDFTAPVHYVDNEWLARPMYRFSKWLRGGKDVAWSLQQMLDYLPYLEFERRVLRSFRTDLEGGAFDIVHRITPMSPTKPSYIAGKIRQPFVIGPLNGNLDWPSAFRAEQRREKEILRTLRNAYRYLPYTRSTYRKASGILAAFDHTIEDLIHAEPRQIIPLPEIGFDPLIFHPGDRTPPFSGAGERTFLYAGRLVPYKLPEAVIRAFTGSDMLMKHRLRVLGDGPERERIEKIVEEAGAGDRVSFEGRKTQAEVAEAMRQSDAFVFPSIRELGAGVVIEAMATGALCMVTDYGAPGALAASGRGIRIPLKPLGPLTDDLRAAMEATLTDPQTHRDIAHAGRVFAEENFSWDKKADFTARVYEAVITGTPPLGDFDDYV